MQTVQLQKSRLRGCHSPFRVPHYFTQPTWFSYNYTVVCVLDNYCDRNYRICNRWRYLAKFHKIYYMQINKINLFNMANIQSFFLLKRQKETSLKSAGFFFRYRNCMCHEMQCIANENCQASGNMMFKNAIE